MFNPVQVVVELAPTLGFLAALLLLAEGCRRANLFDWFGARIGSAPNAGRRFERAFFAAVIVTVGLSLDSTVVLLAPVLLAGARRRGSSPEPAAFACLHLANSASLLLPISNLTGLLAATQAELEFTRFAALMAAPWAAAVAIEWTVLRWRFSGQIAAELDAPPLAAREAEAPRTPTLALVTVSLALAGVLAASAAAIAPAWPALAGAAVLVAVAGREDGLDVPALVRAVKPGFMIAIASVSIAAAGFGAIGLSDLLAALVPAGDSLGALLATCLIAAVLANLINNIPATLILLPVLIGAGEPALLAALIGLGAGPNLTPWGSLATLLWSAEMRRAGTPVSARRIAGLGLATVPATLFLSTVALWVALGVAGSPG